MFSKKIKIFHFLLALLAIVPWFCVLIVKGFTGAASWSLMKLVFAPLGIILFVFSLIYLIIGLIKRKKIADRIISVILAGLLASPLLFLLNIIPFAYPINIDDASPSLTIHSPFKENVTVGWGGDDYYMNIPHAQWASEKWAYDLVMPPYDHGSQILSEYGMYNKDIYSPVQGEIIAIKDFESEILPNTEEFLSGEGNYVYIEVKETGTYLLLNHLLKDSVAVSVGDFVEVGDYLGKVGNSGATSEPHLHIHHQRQDPTKIIHPTIAEGLPLYFYIEEESVMPSKDFVF